MANYGLCFNCAAPLRNDEAVSEVRTVTAINVSKTPGRDEEITLSTDRFQPYAKWQHANFLSCMYYAPDIAQTIVAIGTAR